MKIVRFVRKFRFIIKSGLQVEDVPIWSGLKYNKIGSPDRGRTTGHLHILKNGKTCNTQPSRFREELSSSGKLVQGDAESVSEFHCCRHPAVIAVFNFLDGAAGYAAGFDEVGHRKPFIFPNLF